MKTKIESMMSHARYAACAVLLGCGLTLLGAASCAPAESSTLDEELEIVPNGTAEQIGEAQQADSDNSCTITDCGIRIKESCSVDCKESQTPVCNCACTSRFLGACLRREAQCSCQ